MTDIRYMISKKAKMIVMSPIPGVFWTCSKGPHLLISMELSLIPAALWCCQILCRQRSYAMIQRLRYKPCSKSLASFRKSLTHFDMLCWIMTSFQQMSLTVFGACHQVYSVSTTRKSFVLP